MFRSGHFRGDIGGPFESRKMYAESVIPGQFHLENTIVVHPLPVIYPPWTQTDRTVYNGPLLPCAPPQMSFPPFANSNGETLDQLGATAISRCSPSNNSADLTVAVGELLTEGIPKAIGSTLRTLGSMTNRQRRKALGNEYLNLEFGWKPLVNDLKKFSRAIINAQSILDQYERNSGKLVRRRYVFPQFTSGDTRVVLSDCSPWGNPLSNGLNGPDVNMGKVIRSHTVTVDRWFSGAFTYYVPPADGLRNDIARIVIQARKLLGLSLTPDSLWNLAPWSWAIDWFFNVGDVLKNWTDWAIDNQVLAYGYMMEHSIAEYTYTFSGPSGFPGDPRPFDVRLVSETKIRRKATPYGFGLSWTDFSARQLAIIAALGISRS